MMRVMKPLIVLAFFLPAAALPALAQGPAPECGLPSFHGLWRGPATLSMRGEAMSLIQTEKVGPALGGDILVIKGKSYAPDGKPGGFNAFGIISRKEGGGCEFRAYAQGHVVTVPVVATADRFEWTQPAGPGGTVRYVATVAGGKWHEEGWYERDGKPVSKVFDMTLERIGGTSWPAEPAVAPR